jgi:uncharacterized protein YcfL
MKHVFLLLLIAVLIVGCQSQKKVADGTPAKEEPVVTEAPSPRPNANNVSLASPKVIIYKMKKDYSNNVPVTLSADKKTIVSYPHPRDVYTNGKLAVPTQLKKGYWLDNRGINENVAFLSYTYEEYAALSNVPDLNTLYEKIIDKDPIKEMWLCGSRYSYNDIVNELNEVITNKELEKKFKRIK